MDKELKQLLQEQMKREAEEIMEEVNSDPNVKDVVAPESIRTKLFQQIREYEESQAVQERTEEEEELIRLGKVYRKKKKRKWTKVLGAVAIMAILGAFVGVTAMGGPEKVLKKVQGMFEGREQLHIEGEEGKTKDIKVVDEVEAYDQIEETLGFSPVKMYYMPEGMVCVQASVEEILQMAQFVYQDGDKTITYMICTDSRVGTMGLDEDDTLIDEHQKIVGDVVLEVKNYLVEENKTERWIVEFVYDNVQYSLVITGLEKEEIDKLIDNLYFS